MLPHVIIPKCTNTQMFTTTLIGASFSMCVYINTQTHTNTNTHTHTHTHTQTNTHTNTHTHTLTQTHTHYNHKNNNGAGGSISDTSRSLLTLGASFSMCGAGGSISGHRYVSSSSPYDMHVSSSIHYWHRCRDTATAIRHIWDRRTWVWTNMPHWTGTNLYQIV